MGELAAAVCRAGGPAMISAASASRVVAVCTEGVFTGPKVTVDVLTSSDGGSSFGPSHLVPATQAGAVAATGTATVAVGADLSSPSAVAAVLEMSFNGGSTWQQVYRAAGSSWLELGFTTPEQGAAIVTGPGGGRNTMLVTTDGGQRWSPVRFA